MKKLISVFVLCLSMLFIAGTVGAQNHHRRGPHHPPPHHRPHHPPPPPPHYPPPHHYPIFQCRAHSEYAFGIGMAPDEQLAAQRALNECAVRTPYGYACFLDWCRRIR